MEKLIYSKYKIIEEIDGGSQASIYKVEDIYNSRQVTMKLFNKSANSIGEKIEMSYKEFSIINECFHNNIIKTYDYGIDEKLGPFYTMEYFDGVKLSEYVFDKSINEEKWWEILENIIKALIVIHNRGFLHGDLKPSDILISEKEKSLKIKLIDFGLAEKIEETSKANTRLLKGTIPYIAPEKYSGIAYDHRTDFYSLGIILYELITKQSILSLAMVKQGMTHPEILERLGRLELKPPYFYSNISKELSAVIFKMISFQPTQRYESALEIYEVINNWKKRHTPIRTNPLKNYLMPNRIVNRQKEISSLKEIAETYAGEGHLIICSGGTGIGKSTIAKIAKNYCQQRGFFVCHFENNDQPLQYLIALINKHKEGELKEIEQFDKPYFYEKLKKTFNELANKYSGILIIIEDFENLNKAEKSFLDYILKQLDTLPVLWLITTEDAVYFQKDIFLLLKERYYTYLPLKNLSIEEIREMIQSMLPFPLITPIVAKKIYEYSQGIPLIALENISYLVNLIDDLQDFSKIASLWEKVSFPGKEILQIKKLEKIDSSVRKVLSYASVIGKSFREDILSDIVPKHLKNRLSLILEEALSNNLISFETSSNQYVFQSDVLRENLLKDIGKKEKVAIDESIGKAYEKLFVNKENPYLCSNIAEYYSKAGIYEKAIEYYKKAAEQADKLKLYEDSYEYYSKILKFLDLIPSSKKEQIFILNKIAKVSSALSKWDEAIVYYQEISKLVKDNEDKIEALLSEGEILNQKSDFSGMLKIMEEVKKLEPKKEITRIKINTLMAEAYFGLAKYEEALKYIDQAYELASETNEPLIISKILNIKGNIYLRQSKFDEGEKTFHHALEIIGQQNGVIKASILCNLSNLYLEKSMFNEAVNTYNKAIEIYKENKDILGLACANHNLAIVYGKIGKSTEAIENFKSSMFNFQLINNKSRLKYVYNNIAALYEEMGDLDKASDYYNEALKIAQEEDDKEMMAILYANLANINSIKGIMSKARDYLKMAKELFPKISLKDQILIEEIEGSYYYNLREAIKAMRSYESALEKANKLDLKSDMARILIKMTEASIYAKNYVKAKEYISQAERLLEGAERTPEYSYWLRMKAAILKIARQTVEARRFLQKAISLAKEFGQIYLLGKLYYDLGNIYYKRRILDKARFYLQQSKDIFERLGVSPYLRRIQIINERIDKYEKPTKKISSVIPNYFIDYIEEIMSYISKPTEFYNKILEKAIDFVEAERGVILLFDELTGDLIIKAAIGADEMTIKDVAEISQTAIKEMKKQKEMIFSKCAKEDPKFKDRPSIISHEILSLACVPLQLDGHVIGALYLDSKKSANLFTITDRRMLALFAKLISRSIEIAEGYNKIAKESSQLKLELELKHKYPEIIGNNEKLLKALELVDKVADKDVNVLILGESGTGKELIAKAIHFYGKRKDKKFFAVNCAAFTESLLESELFGHEKGAFTGAVSERKGIFEEAEGGTLFLDEISETSPAMQAKLLRAIQHNEIKRIGSNKIIKVNVRIIAASNKNLIKLIKEGKFRKDLYYRLAVVVIKMPPLRKMQEDIPLLAHHFLKKFNLKYEKHFKGFTLNAINVLKNYNWPGNVRELENVIERIVATGKDNDYIDIEHFPKKYITGAKLEEVSYKTEEGRFKTLPELEREIILQRLNATNWNIMLTAETLGITRFGLYNKMKRLGIQFEMKKGRKPKDASKDENLYKPAGKPISWQES